jgi:uncharacterized cupredoxin-like copper-binding protein
MTPSTADAPNTTPTIQTPPANDASTGFSDREPKNLAAKILIDMVNLSFVDATGATEGGIHVPAGKIVGIHLRNTDVIEHEIVFGRLVAVEDEVKDGYIESLFDKVPADIFVFRPQKMEIGGVTGFAEIELDPGADAWIRTTFPESTKGTWEIGCFVPGHYDAGMNEMLVIE